MGTELAQAYVQIVPSADGISGAIGKILGAEADSAGRSAGGSIATSLAGALTAGLAALGIGKIIANSISSGMEYQTSIAKLGTIADTAAVSMKDLGDDIARTSNTMGIAQRDLAEAAYNTISATGDTAGAMDVVRQAAKLATAGFTDTDSSLKVLTTAMNAYGISASDVDKISDSLVIVQNRGVTTVAELAQGMGRAIAKSSGYGVSLETLEAAYISTTKQGIATAESTTYISSMFAELGKNGSKVSDTLKKKTGKSFSQLMEDGESLSYVLATLMESVDGDKAAFNNLWSSQEAGSAASAIVKQGLDYLDESMEELTKDTNATEIAYSQMTDTFAWKLDNLKTKGENLGIQLFEALYPVLEQLIDKGSEFVENLDIDTISAQIAGFVESIIPAISTIGEFIVNLASNIDLVITAVSALMGFSIVTKVISVVTWVAKLFSGIQALAPIIAALTGPIGAVIAIVGGLVAGFIALWNTNEDFRNAVINIWNGVKDAASRIWNATKEIATNAWNALKTGVSNAATAAKTAIVNTWNNIKTSVSNITNNTKTAVVNAWNNTKTTVSNAINGIKTTISNGLNAAKTTVSNIFTSIKTKISDTINGAKTVVSNGINAIKSKFNFSWSLPHIKLPHFSVQGSFSLNPPSIPHFGVSWYDKGGIFDRPSIIGVGEKRPEFVGALDDLRGIVREESRQERDPATGEILTWIKTYFPEFEKRGDGETDTDDINRRLQAEALREARGVI